MAKNDFTEEQRQQLWDFIQEFNGKMPKSMYEDRLREMRTEFRRANFHFSN